MAKLMVTRKRSRGWDQRGELQSLGLKDSERSRGCWFRLMNGDMCGSACGGLECRREEVFRWGDRATESRVRTVRLQWAPASTSLGRCRRPQTGKDFIIILSRGNKHLLQVQVHVIKSLWIALLRFHAQIRGRLLNRKRIIWDQQAGAWPRGRYLWGRQQRALW